MNSSKGEETILAEALRLPPQERAAHVAQATAGNPELRQEVESLLQNYAAGDFLEAAAAPQWRSTLRVTVPVTEKPGETIGRYKLLQQIGEGGCGVVYMAEQLEPVRRRVALKIVKLGMDTKSVIARFEAERQALALMAHPNIAKVFDAGTTESGRPYFVMELVRGMKITQYCDDQKLSTRARLDLFLQVCQAIQHAHQKGIIHRDIKPSNILVSVDDGVPVPKVIDFGIAKATSGQQLTDRTLFTAFEQFIGTPAYMSPEQAMLTNVDVDTRSDIYALGVLLYELLTGKTPFDAQELLAIGLDEMRRTIREQEPPRPSTRLSTLPGQELSTTAQRRGVDAPKLVSELRGDLDWIIMKALDKDRSRRYETASGLANDVLRHLNNEPVVACPPSNLYRLRKTIQRNKLLFTAGSAVAASLLIGATLSTVLFFRERVARQEANEQASITRAMNEFLLHDLLGWASSESQAEKGFTPDPNMTVREALERTAARIGDRFKGQPLQEALIRLEIGNGLRSLRQSRRAIPHLEQAVELYRTRLGPDNWETLKAMANLALTYHAAGQVDRSVSLFEETLKLAKARLGPDARLTRHVMASLALAYQAAGKLDDALPLLEQTLKLRRASLGTNNPQTLSAMSSLASAYQAAGKFDQALRLFDENVTIMKARPGPKNPKTQDAMRDLAICYRDAGTLDQARSLFEETLQLRKATLGPGDLETLAEMQELAETFRREKNYTAAEAMFRDALSQLRTPSTHAPGEIPPLGYVLHHLADILRERKMLNEARSFAEEAITVYDRHADWPTRERHHAFEVLQAVLKELGGSAEVAAVRHKQIAALRAAADKDDLAALNNLAWMMATSSDSALRDGRTAVTFADRAVAKTGRKDPGMLDTLAAAYAEAGDFAKAVDAQQEAIALCQDERRKTDFTTRLKLYASKTPCREP